MMFNARSRRRCLLAASALALGCSLAPVLPRLAHAEIGVCRRDPRIYLSNGFEVELTNTISDASSDVQHVSYTVHAPAGTSVAGIVYTSGMSGVESVRFYADQAANTYTASTVVTTVQNPTAAVTFTGMVVGPKTRSVTASTSGAANQTLEVNL